MLLCTVVMGCGDKKKKELREVCEYYVSDQHKLDMENLRKMEQIKTDIGILALYAYTNGFQDDVVADDVFYKENQEFLWKSLASIMREYLGHEEEYTASLERLKKTEFEQFLHVDKDGNLELIKLDDMDLTKDAKAMNSNWSFNPFATKAYAAPQPAFVCPLVIKNGFNFAMVGKNCGRKNRQATMYVAQRLEKRRLKELYNLLPKDLKHGESDYITWWKNFENGKYDSEAFDVLGTFSFGGNDCQLDFNTEAQDVGLLASQQFMENCKDVMEAGANLSLELNLKYLNFMCPGISDGIDYFNNAAYAMGANAQLTGTFIKDVTNLTYTSPDKRMGSYEREYWLTEIGKKLIERLVKDKKIPLSKASELKKQKFFELKKLDSGEVMEALQVLTESLVNAVLESDSPRIKWYDEDREYATLVITDEDDLSPAEYVKVQGRMDVHFFKVAYPDDDGKFRVRVYETGEYRVKGVDSELEEGMELPKVDALNKEYYVSIYTYISTEASRELQEKKEQAEEEARQKAEAERLAKEEAEQLAKEEAERLAKEEAERLKAEEASKQTEETKSEEAKTIESAATAGSNPQATPQTPEAKQEQQPVSAETATSDKEAANVDIPQNAESVETTEVDSSWWDEFVDFLLKPIRMITGSDEKKQEPEIEVPEEPEPTVDDQEGFQKVWREFLDFFKNLLHSIFGSDDDASAADGDEVVSDVVTTAEAATADGGATMDTGTEASEGQASDAPSAESDTSHAGSLDKSFMSGTWRVVDVQYDGSNGEDVYELFGGNVRDHIWTFGNDGKFSVSINREKNPHTSSGSFEIRGNKMILDHENDYPFTLTKISADKIKMYIHDPEEDLNITIILQKLQKQASEQNKKSKKALRHMSGVF